MSTSDSGPSHALASLPAHPDLGHLKKQAKALLHAARQRDAEALAQFARVSKHDDAASFDARLLTLASAQHVVARRHGFSTWRDLKTEVLQRRAERLRAEGLPGDRERRMDLLEQSIGRHDVAGVRAMLELDPSLASGSERRRPLDWRWEPTVPN